MGRWRGVLLVVLLVVASLIGSPAGVRPASALTTTAVSGWSTAASTVRIGGTATDAVVVQTGSTGVRRTVQVQRKASTSSTWTTLSSGTTSSTGAFTAILPVPALGLWQFRLHVPPTTTAAGATSATRTLTGGYPTTVSGWSTTSASAPVGYTFADAVVVRTGSGYLARTVELQRKESTATTWTRVSTGTTSGTGAYTARLRVPSIGTWQFRVVVKATSTAAPATTPTRTIKGSAGTLTTVSGWSTTAMRVRVGVTLSDGVVVRTGTGAVARTVWVQRKASTSTSWTTIATGTTSASGSYTARLVAPKVGRWVFRFVVPATRSAAAVTTKTRTLTAVSEDDETVSELRAATFNLSGANNDSKASGDHQVWAERLPQVVAQVVAERPDVVGLQEAYEGTLQYVSLRNALNAAGRTYQITDLDQSASRGTRILYNTTTLGLLSKGAFPYAAQVSGKTTRYLVWANFRQVASGEEFLFVTTHLSPDSSTVRAEEWRELIAKVAEVNTAGRPVVVGGDFNATKFTSMTEELLPAMKAAGFGDVMNQEFEVNPPVNPRAEVVVNGWINSFNDYRRDVSLYAYETARTKVGNGVDWIFASNSLRVRQWKVVIDFDPESLLINGVIPSDHCMVSSIIVL